MSETPVVGNGDGDDSGHPRPPAGRPSRTNRSIRPRTVVVSALGTVAVLVVVLVVVLLWPDPEPRVPSLAGGAFEGDIIRTASTRAAYSPDGTTIAVLTEGGLGVAENGRVRRITGSDTRLVDFAWMPDSRRLLVVEGPSPTGLLPVIDLEGDVVATARLEPAFSPGSGYGIDVTPDARRAVTVAVTRAAIGGRETRDLVVVDLQSGAARTLLAEDAQESRPMYLAGGQVVFTERRDGRSRITVIDPESGRRTPVTRFSDPASLVGVVDGGDGIVFTTVSGDRTRLWRTDATGADRLLLDRFGPAETVVAVDPFGRRALVSAPGSTGEDGAAGPAVLRDVVLEGAVRDR